MLTKSPGLRFAIENGVVSQTTQPDAPIVVYGPLTEEEQTHLVRELEVDPHTLQSAFDPDETARLEFEPSHVAVILKRAERHSEETPGEFRVASLGAFLFEDKLVLIQSDGMPLFEGGRPFSRCESLRGALLRVIYHTIAQFMTNVKLINQVSSNIEDRIEFSLSNRALSSMFELQKGLVYYQSAVNSNHMLLNKLRTYAVRLGFTPEEGEFLEDMIVENEQCAKLVEIYSSILSNLSDARVSIISNNLSVLMKKLTVISIVFMPINILASMGGMSEWTAFTQPIPWPISYTLFGLGMVLVGYLTWLVIRNVGIQETPKRRQVRLGLLTQRLQGLLSRSHP